MLSLPLGWVELAHCMAWAKSLPSVGLALPSMSVQLCSSASLERSEFRAQGIARSPCGGIKGRRNRKVPLSRYAPFLFCLPQSAPLPSSFRACSSGGTGWWWGVHPEKRGFFTRGHWNGHVDMRLSHNPVAEGHPPKPLVPLASLLPSEAGAPYLCLGVMSGLGLAEFTIFSKPTFLPPSVIRLYLISLGPAPTCLYCSPAQNVSIPLG